ncbi:MAG: hypothetical protein AMXMBFR67_01700 [Nitrospira sp.]
MVLGPGLIDNGHLGVRKDGLNMCRDGFGADHAAQNNVSAKPKAIGPETDHPQHMEIGASAG